MPRTPEHRPAPATDTTGAAGTVVEVTAERVAHGGHCVARHEGRVVFVRHTLPGERVAARLTEAEPDATFWRADAVEVLEASPDRVPSAWPAAGPGGVGGGELAHVALPAQRRWKGGVVREQLARLAGLTGGVADVVVEAAPGDDARGGLGYRTRIELVADAAGRAGMRRHRSHDVVALDDMPLASEQVAALAEREGVFTRGWRAGSTLDLVAPAPAEGQEAAPAMLVVDGAPWHGRPDTRPNARRTVTETVSAGGRTYSYRVAAQGFWQVHRAAPWLLAQAVLDAVGHVDGGRVLDLYSGAGLFTSPLADAVGASGRVVAVEGDEDAVRNARRNAHGLDQVELHRGSVSTVLAAGAHGAAGGADVVVLDPPRAGAGKKVVASVAALAPRRVVYVACDPAALARDVAYLAGHGYGLTGLRSFDLFPMTHHVECVAVLDR
ncbi:class I SAM-dependent RNA methyltransferase [Cellulomonas sp. PhB143]|uniref:class I SAM-dependent RNA methyltransferase n=1 Tax=Cellulomonas sp. PhB143 TaxID=2485186 RepID=UPI000F462D87|nr:TRAM domain-containing protein [Cellulomonas sp. PhB143]ROS72976.1 23S rRNA m(5)U-1939 methyltransferase [Cellulomonas sp. PhB143]